jgi:hypothetical protein
MQRRNFRRVALIAAVVFPLPASAIKCVRGFQLVNGQMIATPYCQDEYLAEVAHGVDFKAMAAQIRNNPNFKKEICRLVHQDIRAQTTCVDAEAYWGP